MKNSVFQRLCLLIFLALLLASCSTSLQNSEQQKEQQKVEAMNAKVALFVEERNFVLDFENFKEDTQLRVERNNQSLAALRQKILQERKSSVSDFAAKIRLFEAQNNELKKRVDTFDYSKRNEWENFKAEMTSDFKDLDDSINALFKTSKNYQ